MEELKSDRSQLAPQWMQLLVVGRKKAHQVTSIFFDRPAQELFKNVHYRTHAMLCDVVTNTSILFRVADYTQVASRCIGHCRPKVLHPHLHLHLHPAPGSSMPHAPTIRPTYTRLEQHHLNASLKPLLSVAWFDDDCLSGRSKIPQVKVTCSMAAALSYQPPFMWII